MLIVTAREDTHTQSMHTDMIAEISELYWYFGRKMHRFNTTTRIQRITFDVTFSSQGRSSALAIIRIGFRQDRTNRTKNSFISYLHIC